MTDLTEREHIQEELRVTRARLQRLVAASPVVIYSRKAGGDFGATFFSDNVFALVGYEPRELIQDAKFWAKHIHPEDAPRALAELPRVLKQETYHLEYRFLHSDGTFRWLHDDLQLVRDAAGNRLEIVGSWTDITERKRSEEARRESELRYRSLFNDVPVGLYRITLAGQVLDANPALVQMLGFPNRETLLATNVASQYVDPKACEQWQARMVREGKIFESEVQWRRYDGTIIWVQESAQATFADDGHMLYYEGAVRDITERKRTQEEQRRHTQGLITLNAVATGISQARTLYDILNTTLDAVLKLARKEQGTIHLFKEQGDALMLATHCGLSDALLAEIEKTTTLKDKDLVALALEAGSATALATETKTEVEPAEESQQLTVAVPLKSAARVAGVLCLFGDNGRGLDAQNLQLLTAIGDMVGVAIENQRLVEQMTQIQAWRETDRLRTELIANVSHELRTPLGLIKLFGTALLDQETRLDPATRRQFLQDINEEADKLAQIVSNLLATAHQQNAPVRLNKRATDLARLVKEVMKSMEIQLLRHRFVYTGTDAPLDILIDPQATEQVLRNLLSNAIKYSPSGGTITVHLARESSRALIRVADEGIGIPQADLERIFERFYRVQNDLTQTVSGVGLGLPLARGIVEAHGGRIWAESTLGAGSRFFVSLPGNGEPTN